MDFLNQIFIFAECAYSLSKHVLVYFSPGFAWKGDTVRAAAADQMSRDVLEPRAHRVNTDRCGLPVFSAFPWYSSVDSLYLVHFICTVVWTPCI